MLLFNHNYFIVVNKAFYSFTINKFIFVPDLQVQEQMLITELLMFYCSQGTFL